ncbi:MAG: CBS domain-containing protein [Promethearchaeota archaeon]
MNVKQFLEKIKILDEPDLTDEVVIGSPESRLDKIIGKLVEGSNILAVYVLKDKKPVGIIVKDDIIKRVMIPGKDPSKLKVKDVMTTELEIISGGMDFDDMLRQFLEKSYLSQPVVDNEGFLRGILTIFDLAQHLYQLYALM